MRSTPRLLACWLLLTWLLADSATAAPAAPSQGQELVGTPMRSWAELRWLGPPPGELRGKVVLVRWWSDACPMCSGALPSLGRLYEEHQKEGLVVVGVYHPKPAAPITPEMTQMVQKAALEHEARFPIAIDADWAVLRRWWLSGGKRDYTSASFLIDRQGLIRWVHRGGELHPSSDPAHRDCDRIYSEMLEVLSTVLHEAPGKAPAAPR